AEGGGGVRGQYAGEAGEELAHARAARGGAREVPEGHLALAARQRIGRDTLEGQGSEERLPSRGRALHAPIASSTIWQRRCTTMMWTSWIRAASGCGTSRSWAPGGASRPRPWPVRPTVRRLRARAARTAASTFGDRPDVLIATATSPGRPSASTCRRKTVSKPKSFATAVRIEVSVVRAIAARPLRGRWNRPTSSLARFWASAAEPPFPNARTLPPSRSARAIVSPTSRMRPALSEKNRCWSEALSAAMRRTSSTFMAPIQPQGPGRTKASVVAEVDGQEDRGHGGGVGRDLEHLPLAHPGRNAHGHGQAARDLAFAEAAVAVEERPARAVAGHAGRRDGHVEGQDAAARGLVGRQQDLAAEAARAEGTAQVAHRRTAHERPGP